MNPFRNILRLSLGDFVAKALNFLTFLYLARLLGVASFGVLEFAVSSVMYFALLADGGLEVWATGQAARSRDRALLVARVVPVRLILAVLTACLLLLALSFFPDYPQLRQVLMLYGLTLFAQAVSLKWILLGEERMTGVAAGIVAAQLVFTVLVLAMVRSPEGIVWVPIARFAGDLAMSVYYFGVYRGQHGGLGPGATLRGWREILRPALALGASTGLAVMSFNIDAVLLGFLAGSVAVGLYGAAYKPVVAVLAMPISYFIGLFPVLSRTFEESPAEFRRLVRRSLTLMAIVAAPVGVGGAMLARPIIELLFGPTYGGAAPALQILAWSATLVVLRGTYRQALNAAGRSRLDLLCAGVATTVNVGLNVVLIPSRGIVGAATATLVSEVVWLTMAAWFFQRFLFPVGLQGLFARPAAAAVVMAGFLWLGWPSLWIPRALASAALYLLVLLLLGEPEVRSWLRWPRRSDRSA